MVFSPFRLHFISLLALLSLTACVSQPKQEAKIDKFDLIKQLNTSLLGQKPEIESIDKILFINEKEKSRFLRYYDAHQDIAGHYRIYDYLEGRLGSFNYYGQTYNANDTLIQNAGNCMSLAVLTKAYANLVGIELKYIEETSSPVFFQSTELQLISNHVKTKLMDPNFEPKAGSLYFYEPGLVVDYFPSRNSRAKGNIGENEFMAMYYQNLAADALEQKAYTRAAWIAIEGLTLAPKRVELINLLAVIYRHLNAPQQAESLYLYGLAIDNDDLNLLINYKVLMVTQGRTLEARALQQRIDKADDPSPFRWIMLANEHYQNADYPGALRYYTKAIELAPYMPQAYAGKAKALYLMGKPLAARHAITQALDKTHEVELQLRYQAKLAQLSQD